MVIKLLISSIQWWVLAGKFRKYAWDTYYLGTSKRGYSRGYGGGVSSGNPAPQPGSCSGSHLLQLNRENEYAWRTPATLRLPATLSQGEWIIKTNKRSPLGLQLHLCHGPICFMEWSGLYLSSSHFPPSHLAQGQRTYCNSAVLTSGDALPNKTSQSSKSPEDNV